MKITIIDRKEVPSIKKAGKYNELIEQASKLSGTKSLKVDFNNEEEARNAQGSINRKCQSQKIKVEACRRERSLYIYPIEE